MNLNLVVSCIRGLNAHALYCLFSVALMVVVTKVAKSALDKALSEGVDIDGSGNERSPLVEETRVDLHQSLLVND